MTTSSTYGIAIFHGIGDILNCTPIAKQLKINEPDCHITWFTAAKYRFILENNPYIDEIRTLDGDVLALDADIPRLKAERAWTRFFTPAPYMNYDALPGGSLLDLIKTAANLEWSIEFIPSFSLSEAEKKTARAYWKALPPGKKILVETEFYSEQSHWKDDYAFEMAEILREINPVYVFTAKNKPPFFDEFHEKYPRSIWCAEPFRLNAEFFNLADAFIGVSSGISCVTFSDYCRRDVPRIEVSRGEHWSAAGYAHLSELYICYHRTRFKEAVHSLAVRLSDKIAPHEFGPRFAPMAQLPNRKERVPCLVCGSRQSIPVRGDDVVKCADCGFHYLRDRMTTEAMEEYYTNTYAVNNPQAAPMVRVPPSLSAVDTMPEYISSQRKDLFAKAVDVYAKDIAGGTLIDIGCGWGGLLHHAHREGMEVIGFEFTAPNVEFGRNVLGLDIRQQQFTDGDIAENSVDIVTMSHVLEHVPLPFEFLQKIEYVLKPGGIFSCVVPNFGGLCSQALGEHWSWLERDWHYSQFTPQVLREMFAQAGLYVEECTTTSGDFGKEIPLAVLGKMQPNLTAAEREATLEKIQQSGLGEEIRIIGRKRGTSKARYVNDTMSVLWVRTDSIGDATLSASMLPYLRAKHPHASITVLCQHHLREFYTACPEVDIVIGFDKDRAYRDEAYRNSIALGLQRMNFDIAKNSVFSREPLTDFFTLASGAKTTVALEGGLDNMNDAMRQQNNCQYTQIIPSDAGWKPELERHRDFLRGIGIDVLQLRPQLWLTDADEAFADRMMEDYGLDPEKTVALCAGVLVDIRRYDHYGKALKPLCEEYEWSVIALGADADAAIASQQLEDTGAVKTVNLCGKTTIRQMAAVLRKCRLSVGAETGAAHLACAVGIPHVVLLGGGHFGRFMPYSALTSVVCLPLDCYGCSWQCRYATPHCIRGVKEDIMTEAIRRSLEESTGKPRVFVQESDDWNPDGTMPLWSWFYHWQKPNTVQVIRLNTEEIHRMNVHSLPERASDSQNDYLVTAVVSTYNSEKFMRGCLEDLTRQTLYEQGKLEILVIDAHSEQNEGAIVREFQNTYPHIRYERMPERQPLYESWNYASSIALGRYVANANTDDRRRADCFEALAQALEESGKGIAYSDLTYGTEENRTYDDASVGEWKFPDFDPTLAVLYNLGCFTLLWRKSVWEEIGGFDTRYELAADFDFCTRVGLRYGASHVAAPLTMALLHGGQQSKKEEQMHRESNAIRTAFVTMNLEELMPELSAPTTWQQANLCITIGNAALTLREPWYGSRIAAKPQAAAEWYQRALQIDPGTIAAQFNIALVAAMSRQQNVATQLLNAVAPHVPDTLRAAAEEWISAVSAQGITQELLHSLPLMEAGMPTLSLTDNRKSAMSTTKILFTMYGWNEAGGGTTFPHSIAIRLISMGYDVGVFYAAGHHPTQTEPYFMEETEDQGVRLFGVYNRPTTFLDDKNPLREVSDGQIEQLFETVLSDFQPTVVHFHNFLGLTLSMADLAHTRGIPTVYTPHNYHLIDPRLYLIRPDLTVWKSTNFFENSELVELYPDLIPHYEQRQAKTRELLNSTIDYTLAVSGRQRELLAAFAGSSTNISVVNQVPESTDWVTDLTLEKTIRRPIKFGFIGGLMALKGVHVLAQAAQNFTSEAAEFHVYGSGLKEYEEIVKSIDRKGNLIFHGEYSGEDLLPLSMQLDAIILPSVWEDCAPLVIAEALSLGLPVIASNIGGFPDFITDGVNGRLYNYKSYNELSNIIADLVVFPSTLEEWRQNTTLNYNFTDFVNFMAEFYNSIAQGERPNPQDVTLRFHDKRIKPIDEKSAQDGSTGEPLNRLLLSENVRGGFSNRVARATMPTTLPSPLYLNLGCGRDVRPDFINIDLFSDDDRVVRMDIRKIELPDNIADGVLASDVLEHFSHRETDDILREWARVLKPGGELIIRCPSLRLQMQAYQNGVWDADVASYMIFGGQTNPGDYHCIGFDERSIRRHLEKAGFEVMTFEEVDTPQTSGYINLNMTVQARKKAVAAAVKAPVTATIEEKAPAPAPSINLVWEGSQFVLHSLALINREQCANVIAAGVAEVTIVPFEPDQFSPEGNAQYELLAAHDIRQKAEVPEEIKKLPYVWVRHQWPPSEEEPKGAKWVIQQPWEFTALRKDFVELFNRADEIWTPSNYSRTAFIDSGVDSNKVQIVPNGVNPTIFTPHGSRLEVSTKKRFKFLFIGGTIYRKGIDILLQAYATTFTAKDDVCLIIKDMGGDSYYKGQTAEEMIEKIRSLDGAPEILYSDAKMSDEDMASLYRTCDVFVSPYRGEGFSLPTLEAMACGLPVIVTDGGATDDFVDDTVGWRIRAGKKSIGTSISGYELTSEGFMLEPESEHLKEILRFAYAHPIDGMHKGIAGSQRARTDWSWKRATMKMLSRLDALSGTDMARRAETTLLEVPSDGISSLAQAEVEMAQGVVDTAIPLYQEAITLGGMPEHYRLLAILRLAWISVSDGDVKLAREFVKKADAIRAVHPDSIYIESLCYALESKWVESLEFLNTLLGDWKRFRYDSALGIRLDTLLCDSGRALFRLGDLENAHELYTQALKMNPDNADACYGAALCFQEAGAKEEAKTMFEWAVKLQPDYEEMRGEFEGEES
ncbi:MAG: glycosyltransferase [Candidatus Kapaibacterium sp.]